MTARAYMWPMKQIILATALALSPIAAVAQSDPPEGDVGEGMQLLSEGAKLVFRGLLGELQDLEPEIEEGWETLLEMFDQINLYHAPEVLPNGDIIIRRRIPLVPEEESLGETEL